MSEALNRLGVAGLGERRGKKPGVLSRPAGGMRRLRKPSEFILCPSPQAAQQPRPSPGPCNISKLSEIMEDRGA